MPHLQVTCTKQAAPLQNETFSNLEGKAQQLQWRRSVEEHLLSTGRSTGQMGLNSDTMGLEGGNGAWSATIPARRVFSRLREAVPMRTATAQPTMEEQLRCSAQAAAGAQLTEEGAQPMDLDDHHDVQQPQVEGLFTEPEPPVLSHPPQRRQRNRRTFDMTAVLQQYVDGVEGPLPEHVIAALTAFLDLDDTEADLMTEALIEQAGEGLEDLQHVEGAAVPAAA
ncbi:unnamed protein product [Urochloa humidicola]